MKKLFTLLLVLIACSVSAIDMGPYDPGAARKSDLGTISTKAATDYVATSALALRLDTTNASISENLDVAGNVGAATVNGVAPLTAAEKTQALVGSTTVDFAAASLRFNTNAFVSQPVAYVTDAATTIATFTFQAYSGGVVKLWLYGVKANTDSVNTLSEYRIDSGNGALTITPVVSDTWGGHNATVDVALTAADGYTCNLVLTGESPNYYDVSGLLEFQGRATVVEIRKTIP